MDLFWNRQVNVDLNETFVIGSILSVVSMNNILFAEIII